MDIPLTDEKQVRTFITDKLTLAKSCGDTQVFFYYGRHILVNPDSSFEDIFDQCTKAKNSHTLNSNVLVNHPGEEQALLKIRRAIEVTKKHDLPQVFSIDGVVISVKANSNADFIFSQWKRAMSGFIVPEIGPYKPDDFDYDEEARRDSILQMYKMFGEMIAEDKNLWTDIPVPTKLRDAFDQFSLNVSLAKKVMNNTENIVASGKPAEEAFTKVFHISSDMPTLFIVNFRCVVLSLKEKWKHGKALEKWFNRKVADLKLEV